MGFFPPPLGGGLVGHYLFFHFAEKSPFIKYGSLADTRWMAPDGQTLAIEHSLQFWQRSWRI
jgi:hypothetical protein